MKAKIGVGFLALFAVLVSVYTGYWFYQAGRVKSQVEEAIAKVNIVALLEAPQFVYHLKFISYDSIETMGFPARIEFEFKNLKLETTLGEFAVEKTLLVKEVFQDMIELQQPNYHFSAKTNLENWLNRFAGSIELVLHDRANKIENKGLLKFLEQVGEVDPSRPQDIVIKIENDKEREGTMFGNMKWDEGKDAFLKLLAPTR